jgi:hypothetical protein
MPMAGNRGGLAETGHGRLVEAHAAGVEAQGLSQAAKTPPISALCKGPLPWPQGSGQPKGPPADVSGVAPGTPLSCFSNDGLPPIGCQASVTGCLVQWHGALALACMETSRRRQHARSLHPAKNPLVSAWRWPEAEHTQPSQSPSPPSSVPLAPQA